MKIYYLLFVLIGLLACKNESNDLREMKIDVLNNYEFMLNGKEHTIAEFEEVFVLEDSKLFKKSGSKYDIKLRVHKDVEMKTLQMMKVEFSKVKSHIDEIKYSHEE